MEDKKVILDRMLGNINDKYDKTKGSFFYDSANPAAIEFEKTYKQVDTVASKLGVENLNGTELERFVNQRTGITRKQATYATTMVTIKGQEGTNITKGILVASDTVNYIVQEDKMIGVTGQANILVKCEIAGAIGNVPQGSIRYFPITIQGLISVTNIESVTNGYEAETDASLLERYYLRIRTPATSGNKYHYLNWAKEVVGVGDARVIPLWNGNNTVKVVVIDSNKQAGSVDLIGKVQTYIDPNITGLGEGQAPIGAFCTVVSATSKAINITFTVVNDEGYSIEEIKANVENNITEYLKVIAFKDNIVSYAKIGAIILGSEGILDYSNLKINDGIFNISIASEEVAILGTVVVSE